VVLVELFNVSVCCHDYACINPWKIKKRQAVLVQRNTESRLCATTVPVEQQLNITYFEYAFVSLRYPASMRMRHIVCGLIASTMLLHITS
jgi:hypothetical protein